MKWVSVLSQAPDLSGALEECARQIGERWEGTGSMDLVVAFASPHFASGYERLPGELRQRFPDATLLGCSGAGVIGDGQEVEERPGLSLTVAHLPGVSVQAFHLVQEDLPTPDAPPDAWVERVGTGPEELPQFLLLVEPYSIQGEELLAGLDYAYPGSVKIGGLASGGRSSSSQALFLDDVTYREGAVGVALSGNILVDTVVAQGCRPIGEPMRVTQAQRNILMELDGEPPLHALQRVYRGLPARDQELVQRNLFLGIAMDPLQERSGAGEFLVRNLMGADTQRGILTVGALLQEGQVVQFHVRDATTSAEDLGQCLGDFRAHSPDAPPEGALLFSCTGRGMHLYGRPDHDTGVFRDTVGEVPLAGFFCAGEIGPVGGATYLHGFTSSFAIFRSRPVSG